MLSPLGVTGFRCDQAKHRNPHISRKLSGLEVVSEAKARVLGQQRKRRGEDRHVGAKDMQVPSLRSLTFGPPHDAGSGASRQRV